MPPAIPDKIPCDSVQQLEQELATLRDALSFEETEESWDRIARALTRFSATVKGGGYKYEKELVNGIKASTRPIVSAMNSERTRLSAAALDCLTTIAPRIGLAFEALVPLFVPHILRLSTRSNKVYVARSQASLALIIGYCHIPAIIPYLLAGCKESKIVTGRAAAVEGVLRCLNKWDWTQKDIKAKVCDVEEVIKTTGRDKDSGIRQTSRKVFEAYKALFPERVDEFTGPLTPVMRKYLDIKPQPLVQKAIERTRPPSAQEKLKRPATKPDLASSTSAVPSTTSTEARALGAHARSASSNAVVDGSSESTGTLVHPHPTGPVASTRSMGPPTTIPSRARVISRTQALPDITHDRPEQHNNHDRQRVLSTASSNFSIKSAPSNSHPGYEHRPPVRLAASQSHHTGVNTVVAASSGQARRVRRVVAVEPHPANRPDLFAMAHKAPVRPTPLLGVTAPRIHRPNQGPGREPADVVQSAPTSATGIVFPTSEPEPASATAVERKGAQRVPKPGPPPPATAPPKAERPATAMSEGSKREVKPSIFRRGAPGAPASDRGKKKEKETPKEGFVPRRGGGVTQPTLSQLSKQRAPASAHVPSLPAKGKAVDAPLASKRPVWGTGSKPTVSRGLPASRAQSRNGVARVLAAKQGEQAKETKEAMVKPTMVPLPMSPGKERDIVPHLVPLPESPRVSRTGQEQAQEKTPLDGEPAAEASEPTEGSTGSETNTQENQSDSAQDSVQEAAQDSSDDDIQGVFTTETAPVPRTPPFPATDGESDEDELEAIEFTTGEAYDPAGVPIKTPRKVVGTEVDNRPLERNPLSDVVLNA